MTSVASTLLALAIDGNAPSLAQAGSRVWLALGGGTLAGADGVRLYYFDDGGSAWLPAGGIQVSTDTGDRAGLVTYQDAGGTWHLHVIISANNSANLPLKHRAVHGTKVSGGTAVVGDLTASINIDAGGTNLGTSQGCVFVTNTSTNPRLWVVFRKTTASSINEVQVAYCSTGIAADTAGNWSTTNFTNLGSTSGSDGTKFGCGVWWQVAGVDRATIVFTVPAASSGDIKAVTFDPAASAPTPGGATVVCSVSAAFDNMPAQGPQFCIAAIPDAVIVGRRTTGVGATDWKFFRSPDGTSGSWVDLFPSKTLTMGRATITADGTQFWILYNQTFSNIILDGSAMSFRLFTPALNDQLDSAVTFSSGNGNALSAIVHNGKLLGAFRSGTGTPSYPLSSDVTLAYAARPLGVRR